MATVIVQAVASLDGFIARPDDLPGPIFDWYEAGDVDAAGSTPTTSFHVSQQSGRLPRHLRRPAASVIGRHLFDFVDGWGGHADRRATASSWSPTATPTSGRSATPRRRTRSAPTASRTPCASATEHAGDGTVLVCAGEVGGQVVAAGLADEVAIDLAPVFLGRGKRFLGSLTDEIVLDDPHVVVQGERVLHLSVTACAAEPAVAGSGRRQPDRETCGPVDFRA